MSRMDDKIQELLAYCELYYESYAACGARWVSCLN